MKNVIAFFSEVKFEMSRVMWPGYREFMGSTLIALVIISAFALYLGLLDRAFMWLVGLVF